MFAFRCWALLCLTTRLALAGITNTQGLPGDSVVVFSVDLDQFNQTKLGQAVAEALPRNEAAEAALGFRPGTDLHQIVFGGYTNSQGVFDEKKPSITILARGDIKKDLLDNALEERGLRPDPHGAFTVWDLKAINQQSNQKDLFGITWAKGFGVMTPDMVEKTLASLAKPEPQILLPPQVETCLAKVTNPWIICYADSRKLKTHTANDAETVIFVGGEAGDYLELKLFLNFSKPAPAVANKTMLKGTLIVGLIVVGLMDKFCDHAKYPKLPFIISSLQNAQVEQTGSELSVSTKLPAKEVAQAVKEAILNR